MICGKSLVNEDEIVSKFVFFYNSLHSKVDSLTEFSHDLDWSPIDYRQSASLVVAFTEEEVWKAVKLLDTDITVGWFYLIIIKNVGTF